MSLLEMNHIRKSFDGVEVIKDISLSVEKRRDPGDHRSVRFREIDAASVRDDA